MKPKLHHEELTWNQVLTVAIAQRDAARRRVRGLTDVIRDIKKRLETGEHRVVKPRCKQSLR